MIMTLSQVLTFNLLKGLVHDILPPLESLLRRLSGPRLLHICYCGFLDCSRTKFKITTFQNFQGIF